MSMTVTIVHHRVADFDAWKETYDGFRDAQREGGVRTHTVLRTTDDPNLVVVTHSFDSADAARAFFANEDLKGAMARGGVDVSSLSIEFLDEVDSGTL
jgi:heme-degrading monooxygenase HmoA